MRTIDDEDGVLRLLPQGGERTVAAAAGVAGAARGLGDSSGSWSCHLLIREF